MGHTRRNDTEDLPKIKNKDRKKNRTMENNIRDLYNNEEEDMYDYLDSDDDLEFEKFSNAKRRS